MPKQPSSPFSIPLYPFLIALYPILYVYSRNIGLTSLYSILPVILIVWVITGAIWFVLNIWFKDRHKAGVLTSISVLLLLTYGNIYAATDQVTFFGLDLHMHRHVMLAVALIIILSYFILKNISPETASKTGRLATVFAFLLLITPTITLISSSWDVVSEPENNNLISSNKALVGSDSNKPDVYYFILDGYGRADMLQERLGFDNSNFTKELEKRGFFIANKSHANYSQTLLSVTSSLNMDYLQNLYDPSTQSITQFRNTFINNTVISNFKKLGYTTINTASGYDFTNTVNTDLTLSPSFSFTEFESIIYNNSIVPHLLENDLVFNFTRSTQSNSIRSYLFNQHREKINFALESPRNPLTDTDKPVMAFLHVLLAHEPFVFNVDGSPNTPKGAFALGTQETLKNNQSYKADYAKGYSNQVQYGNKELLKTIDAIQNRKGRKSIIILQGDHGPWTRPEFRNMTTEDYKERMSILNAIYFPDAKAKRQLYNEISPVNTFRLIFNTYFNAKYELKEDRVYFSDIETKFIFKDVTSKLVPDTINKTVAK